MFQLEGYQSFLDSFVEQSGRILGDRLTGIYLHGSAAMGCFNGRKSDIDLLIVTKGGLSVPVKRQYMDMAVRMNAQAPAKGLEFSIVREDVCRPFVYPTPFELHFSIAHLGWYQSDPEGCVSEMNGTDPDLAAHAAILYHRGKTLFGREIQDVFSEVRREDYWDSIVGDIENAAEDVAAQPLYIILNLCRVLAYKREGLILSKREGGEWGLAHLPRQYRNLVWAAMEEYRTGVSSGLERMPAREYAEYMLAQIMDNRGGILP
ncbi:MAG: DUF4111 domain-containing protein [Oscillibacter sp.]|nr:DUF4111 domain-containing protein [Oscillibacter sp.]